MSRTFIAVNGTVFKYDSDFSGTVTIQTQSDGFQKRLEINGEDILEFVAQFVINSKISELEQLSPSEVLGVRTPHD